MKKPFRPVWDRGPIEESPPEPDAPAGPPPLPPASAFEAAPVASDPADLPSFDHLVPPDPAGYAQAIREAQDTSDAETVLRAHGLAPQPRPEPAPRPRPRKIGMVFTRDPVTNRLAGVKFVFK